MTDRAPDRGQTAGTGGRVPDADEALAAEAAEGGDSACWAHLVCPECGAISREGHRPGCELAPSAP